MFGSTGDLVLQRKVEKPHLTVERVEEAVQNIVVQPPAPKVEAAPQKVETAPQKVEAAPQKVEAAPQKVETAPQKVEAAVEKKVEPRAEKTADAPKKNNRKGK
jgi:hypothetical protein